MRIPSAAPHEATAPTIKEIDSYLAQHDDRIHQELFELLRIPSVSTREEHSADTARAADWIVASLNSIGVHATIFLTGGHPIVVGEWRLAPGAPTVLIYGHYDVQPPEPLDLWTSPPFEPVVRDGKIFARGAVDDKAQFFIHIKALEALLSVRGSLPVNVVLMVEGEEEMSSPHLAQFVRRNRDLLAAKAIVISDSAMFDEHHPSILSSLRAIVYLQVDVTGPSSDLHSGVYGGAVVNPANALARMLSTLQADDGRVTIEGFYDRVRPWKPEILEKMRRLPFDEDSFRLEAGVPELGGEPQYTILERRWTRPTCDVHGLYSGYTAEGAKTIVPASATAKVSFRLVPDQVPDEISELVQRHLLRVAPRGVSVSVRQLGAANPWRADVGGPVFTAARRALESVFGSEPVIVGEGGTIPIVGELEEALGAPALLVGFGLPGANAHAPDEWISQENFRKGMRAIAALWDEYAIEMETHAGK